MIKGLYRSASAMIPRIKQQETIANNLANAAAPGFKRDKVFSKELSRVQAKQAMSRSDWQTPMIDQVYADHSQGTLDRTDNPLDMALEGSGFFVLEGEDGELFLTRAGNFMVSPDGFLVSPGGHRVLSEGGPIAITSGEISVSEAGQVAVDGTEVGRIRVADITEPAELTKSGDSEFRVPEGIELRAAVDYVIRNGYLEASNVNTIREMVDMISSFRSYESDAQALKAQDDSLEKLINNVGRIR
ncbi:MAG: flagellar basal-body rod protein FlgF [Candidatus Zixiibacteriota bacterium]|nr:MAG: flagellar basal-body rod protein FlgF [candidate division Zixibacteria bacterium]